MIFRISHTNRILGTKNPAMGMGWDKVELITGDSEDNTQKTAKDCYKACRSLIHCNAFTWYLNNSCSLFSSASSLREEEGAISGVSKNNKFDCSHWQGAICSGGIAWKGGVSTTQVIRTLDACNPLDAKIESS